MKRVKIFVENYEDILNAGEKSSKEDTSNKKFDPKILENMDTQTLERLEWFTENSYDYAYWMINTNYFLEAINKELEHRKHKGTNRIPENDHYER